MEAQAVERSKSLQSQVFDRLLSAIMTGRFPFGTLLSEKVLAGEFETSKTPVREAFVQLHSIGLVDIKPQRGWVVFRPTVKQIRELCEVRIILEAAALRAAMVENPERFIAALTMAHDRAARKVRSVHQYQLLDDAFHLEAFRQCNNDTLLSAYEIFRPRIHALRVNLQNQNPKLLNVSSQDHSAIVRHLGGGHLEAAIEIIARHVRRMGDAYASLWETTV